MKKDTLVYPHDSMMEQKVVVQSRRKIGAPEKLGIDFTYWWATIPYFPHPMNAKMFFNLEEGSKLQRDWQVNIDTDDPQFLTFLQYGIHRNCKERSLLKSFGHFRIINKRLICFVLIPANGSYTLMVKLPKNLNQWRLKDKILDVKNSVNYNHDLNALIQTNFGVVTVCPDDPNPVFNSYRSSKYLPSTSSSQLHLQSSTTNSSCSTIN